MNKPVSTNTIANGARADGQPAPSEGRAPIDLFQLAVMLMVLVAVWRVQDLFPVLNKIKIQYLAPALGLIMLLANNDSRRRVGRLKTPLLSALLVVLAMVALSVPTSLWPGKSFNFLYNDHAKTVLLLVMMAASIRNITDLRRYLALHIVGAITYSYFVITTFKMRNGRLGDLIYYDSNDLGLLLVCTLPFCVYFLRPGAKTIVRAAATGAVVLLMMTIVKTGSRGAFLGFIACGAYLLFNFSAIPKTVRIYAVGTMTVLLFAFGGPVYWDMMSTLLSPKSDPNWTGDVGRKQIWKRGIGYMLTHPVTGVGARAFGIAEGTISQISARQQEGIGLKWSAAHNSFVEVGAELGLIGLAAFLLALARAWRFVRRIGRPDQATRAGPLGPLGHAIGGTLVAYMVSGFFLSAGYSAFLYTVFAMVIGMMKLSAESAAPVLAAVDASAPRRAPRGVRPPQPILVGAQPILAATGRRRRGRSMGAHPGPAPIPPRSPSTRP